MNTSTLTINVAATVPAGLYALQIGGVPDIWGWGFTTTLILTVVDPPDREPLHALNGRAGRGALMDRAWERCRV